MKIRIRSIISHLLLAALFLAIGYVSGLRRGQYQAALEEAKVARASLNRDDITLDPQLREYMKGRIYYLIGTKFYHARSEFGREWDEGTVDTNILRTPIYAKDPTFAPRTYTEAVADMVH